MGTRTNSYIHNVHDKTPLTSVGTSYSTGKRHTLTLGSFPLGSPFRGRLGSVKIQVSSIASSAAQVSCLMTTDADGDKGFAEGKQGPLTTGLTTATDGWVVYVLDFVATTQENDTIYVFYKTDTGTVTIDSVTLTWQE